MENYELKIIKYEISRNKLEEHIAQFPSSFDKTNIASQLREHAVNVKLYADIRDSLWKNYESVKERKAKLETFLLQIRNEIDDEI